MDDTMLLGQYAAHHVHLITACDSNQHIRPLHIRIIHGDGAGAIGSYGQHIKIFLDIPQLLFLLVYNDNIVFFLG